MQLNVSRWLHDCFAPARRPRKIIPNAKRQAFLQAAQQCRDTARCRYNFLYSFFVAVPCSVMKRARFSLLKFFLIAFLIKKTEVLVYQGKSKGFWENKAGKNEKIQLGSELSLFLSFLVLIAFNILSSCFHFSSVDHVVYEGHNDHSQQCFFTKKFGVRAPAPSWSSQRSPWS